ncbi:MAG: glutamate--tRNA ligase family protein [Planctomycetota bacterium]|nr:glutamate--tRNA ligase family protein [Planctomycetota bacterium]
MTAPEKHTPASPRPATRLAPSPTGALHLGNARTFMITWALARQRGWRIVLRIEDLDTPRTRPGALEDAIDTLEWLGVDWDEGPIIQTRDIAHHVAAVRRLAERGLAYPCALTRAQIEHAASAPHEDAGAPEGPPGTGAAEAPGKEIRFPASLRPALGPRAFDDERTNWRFATPDRPVSFADECAGAQTHRPARTVGDFVVWTSRAQPSYQLACVVDDHRQGITHVVRGDDLLDSAARQTLLYEALELGPPPSYCHLPLVRGEDGKRLAKRHGDTRVARYRAAGVAPQRVIGLLAWWSGFQSGRAPLSAQEFREACRIASIPPGPVTFTSEDDAWLLSRR